MKQRVPPRSWYAPAGAKGVRTCSSRTTTPPWRSRTSRRSGMRASTWPSAADRAAGPARCCTGPTATSWPAPTWYCTVRAPGWRPRSGGGTRNCRSSSRARTSRPAARSRDRWRRCGGPFRTPPGTTRRRRRRLDRDGDLAGQPVAAGQLEVVAAPEAARVVPVHAVAAGQQPHGLIGGGQHLGAVRGLQAGLAQTALSWLAFCPGGRATGPGPSASGTRARRWTGTACRPAARRCAARHPPSPAWPAGRAGGARPAGRTAAPRR